MVEPSLLGTGVGTGFLVGAVVGTRHAFEADHLAAVATLVGAEGRAAATGAAWGVGHAFVVVSLSGGLLVAGVGLPAAVAAAAEAVVALLLVGLGLRALAGRTAVGVDLLRHLHDKQTDRPETGHLHVTLRGRQLGVGHSHVNGESFAVGVFHGFAGSGVVMVVLASTAPTLARGAAFLLGFAVASVGAMAAVAWAWGRAGGHTGRLRRAAGLASLAAGGLLLGELASTPGLAPW